MHKKSAKRSWRVEWPTVAMLVLCYGVWLGAGLWVYGFSPLLALTLMAVCVGLHSSLQHEIMHGHPTRNGLINEALVSLPLGLFYPYRRYKVMHLKHHNDERLTDPYDDPESYYRTEGDWQALNPVMRGLLQINHTLLGRIFLGPLLMVIGFYRSEWRLVQKDKVIRKAWLLHGLGVVAMVAIVQFGFGIPVWLYLLTAAYFGTSLIGIRSYCEHQWAEVPEGRTVIVERSWLAWLFLYNNLHIVHHKLPNVPWYTLPVLYWQERETWQRINGGYVFGSYVEIFARYGLKAKEPHVHPVIGRSMAGVQADPDYATNAEAMRVVER